MTDPIGGLGLASSVCLSLSLIPILKNTQLPVMCTQINCNVKEEEILIRASLGLNLENYEK